MAVRDIKNGKEYLVYIDETTPITAEAPAALTSANWKAMVCLASNALNVTVNGIDATSKCTDGWADSIPGDGSWEITSEGQAVALADNQTIEVSAEQLIEIAADKQPVWAAIFNPAKNTVRAGVVFISSLSENFSNNAIYGFTLTLTGRGKLYTTRDFVEAG